MTNNPEAKLTVVGHASKVGSPGYNQSLSLRRAEVVVNRLASDYGVDRSQMAATGQGYYQPGFSLPSAAGLGATRGADIRGGAPGTNAGAN
jgi:adhesin transport system outer membrane protein